MVFQALFSIVSCFGLDCLKFNFIHLSCCVSENDLYMSMLYSDCLGRALHVSLQSPNSSEVEYQRIQLARSLFVIVLQYPHPRQ